MPIALRPEHTISLAEIQIFFLSPQINKLSVSLIREASIILPVSTVGLYTTIPLPARFCNGSSLKLIFLLKPFLAKIPK